MKVSLEQVIHLEPDQIFYARFLGVLLRLLDPLRVDVDAYAASAVVLSRGNDDAAIATAQVVDHIGFLHIRKFQHRLNCRVRSRYVRHLWLNTLGSGE